MQIKNKGARVWTVSGVACLPGQVTDVPNAKKEDVKGNDELEIVKFEDVEFKETATEEGEGKVTKADLQAALDEKGIEYASNANKAELQVLLDGAE